MRRSSSEPSSEELGAAGLGTVMGVTADPKRVHALQRLARENGHPPLFFFQDTERGERTILPSSLAQSFTWNLDLVEAGARMAARETAATGHNGILGPVADHSCTTRNGRTMETKGESPWLASRYVERLVRGFQGASLDARAADRLGQTVHVDTAMVEADQEPEAAFLVLQKKALAVAAWKVRRMLSGLLHGEDRRVLGGRLRDAQLIQPGEQLVTGMCHRARAKV